MRSLLAAALLLAACSSASTPEAPVPPAPSSLLVAYIYGGSLSELAAINAEKLTHINYAFANLTATGDVVLERGGDAERLRTLVGLKAKNPNLKVLLSVGGWTWSDHFSDVAFTEAGRARFAQTAVALVEDHQLDGLDIDWEYPGQAGDGNRFREEDRETFTLLLNDTRAALDALGDGYELTIAAAAGQRFLDLTNMDEAHLALDFVNLMTYDFVGGWSAQTGHHANLHPSDATSTSTSESVDAILAAGVPAEKIVVGAAFYGYGWRGVAASETGLGQTHSGEVFKPGYSELMANYIGQDGYVRAWDEDAAAPTLWNADTQTFISYEDPESVGRKAAYVRERGLGGLMYWQHSHDFPERLLDAAHAELR